MNTQKLSRIALIAAVYVVFTVLPPFAGLAYGPIQVRVSEALTVLPYLTPLAIPGLFLGCILANLASPFPLFDLTLGPLASLGAALLTRRARRPHWAPLPPVVINAFVVSAYVGPLTGMPYWLTVAYIGAGQLVACYGMGYPLLLYLERRRDLRLWLDRG